MTDRGTIEVGMRADLNVFDLQQLEMQLPEFAYDLPAGAGRWVQRVTGFALTMVRGVITFEDDEPTVTLISALWSCFSADLRLVCRARCRVGWFATLASMPAAARMWTRRSKTLCAPGSSARRGCDACCCVVSSTRLFRSVSIFHSCICTYTKIGEQKFSA